MFDVKTKPTTRRTYLLPELPQRENVPVYGLTSPTGKDIVLLYDRLDGFYGRFTVKGAEYQVVNLNASLELTTYRDGYKVVEQL